MKKGYGCIALLSALALASGCASVKTDEDWQSLKSQAAARTGVEPVWVNRDGKQTEQQVMADQAIQGGLTRDEAIALALSNNPEMQARFEDLGIARADLVQAGLFTNPSVGAVFRRPDGGGSWNNEASVTMPISDLWQVPLRKKAARHNLEATTQGILNDIVSTTAEVQRTYNAIQYAENSAGAIGGTAGRSAGSSEAYSPDIDTAAPQHEAESFRTSAVIERARLARLLGLDDAQTVTLSCAFEVPPSTSLDEGTLTQQAMANNPNVMMLRHRVEALKDSIKLQKWRVIGDVNLGAGALRDPLGSSANHDGHDAGDATDNGNNAPDAKWYYGPSLSLQIPIFDQNQAGIAKAEHALRQAEDLLKAEEGRVREQVRSGVNRYRMYEAQGNVYRNTILPARDRSIREFRGTAGYNGALSDRSYSETLNGGATRGQLDALADLEKATGTRILKGCEAVPAAAAPVEPPPSRVTPVNGTARLEIQNVDIQPRAGAPLSVSAPVTRDADGNVINATNADGTPNTTINNVSTGDGSTKIDSTVSSDCNLDPNCAKPRVVYREVNNDGTPVK